MGYTGHRVMELLKVIYLGQDEIKPDKQLGTIRVNDGSKDHYLYKVDQVDLSKPSIKHGDEVTLTGPRALIGCVDEVVIDVDLFCGSYKGSFIFWWYPKFRGHIYEIAQKTIVSDAGEQILIVYVMFEHAVKASLEVKLFSDDTVANVSGVIAAKTCKTESNGLAKMMFLNKHDNKIKVDHGQLIPLSTSIVAVPLESPLFLEIVLHVDDFVFKRKLEFDANIGTMALQSLHHDKYGIQVRVTWEKYVDEEDNYSEFQNMFAELSCDGN